MKGSMSMRAIYAIVLLMALALLLAIFYAGSLGFVETFISQVIKR